MAGLLGAAALLRLGAASKAAKDGLACGGSTRSPEKVPVGQRPPLACARCHSGDKLSRVTMATARTSRIHVIEVARCQAGEKGCGSIKNTHEKWRISFRFARLLCCAGGGTQTHTRLPSPNFESDKDRGIVRDQVRPDCHQSCHQDSGSMKEGPGLLETPALSGLTNTQRN